MPYWNDFATKAGAQMREQSKPKQGDPAPGVQLQAWAEAVRNLSPARSQADFDSAKLAIVAGLQRLAGQLRLTR